MTHYKKCGEGFPRFFIALCLLSLGGVALWGATALSNIIVSEGTRVGTVTKLSTKGLVFKTMEGELAVGGENRTQTWAFTDRGGECQADLQSAQESQVRVKITYNQYTISMPWSAGTSYDVTKVEVIR